MGVYIFECLLEESLLLKPHLPDLNAAAYATSETARREAIRALVR